MEIYQEHSPVHKGVVSFACDLPNSTPVSTRPGRKPLSAYNSNSGRKGTPHAKMKSRSDMRKERTVLKTPLSVTINTEKENQPSSSTVFDAMSSPPNSAQSFRRALRGTPPKQGAIPIGQTIFALPEENAMDEVEQKTISFATKRGGGLLSKRSQLVVRPLVGGALGPPQRVAPKTPNFLLRTEFDDDSMNEMEESLLVSPPGALWSVLGAAHDPSSASSTGIVIVPPHTAATIHEITTSQKKRQEQRSWTSPPLQPRSLLRTTPEGEQEADDESEQQNDRALNIITESPEIILPTTRKSVAMDLSTMFSDERKQKPTKPTNQPNPPQHLLRRLQKPTVSSNAAIEPKQALLLASKEQKIVDSTLLNTKKEGLDVVVAPVCGENREAINLPNLASSKASTILLGTPPQHFSKCRSKPDVSSCKELPRDEAVDHEGLSFEPRSVRVAQKAPLNARKTEILHVSSGKGISMDMSNLLSDVTTTTLQHAIPPPHLLKRLEQRTFKKTHSNKRVGKENEAPEASKIPANTNPPIRNVLAIRSSATSSLKTGPGRALRVPTSKAEAKERPSLQKNDKFFPGPTAISPSKGEIESKGIRIGVKFEISPPVPKEDKVVKKTRPPPGSPKARSPIKITRGPDDWAAKQCDTFVSWLNYTFHPDDDEEDDSTLNRSGLRALVIHRRLAQVRYRAAELFQSDEMRRVRTIVQSEISRGRLTIRSDRDLYADLSLRKQAINLLLSYTTPWLRLGLEVMFGECIMPDNLHVYGTSQMVWAL